MPRQMSMSNGASVAMITAPDESYIKCDASSRKRHRLLSHNSCSSRQVSHTQSVRLHCRGCSHTNPAVAGR